MPCARRRAAPLPATSGIGIVDGVDHPRDARLRSAPGCTAACARDDRRARALRRPWQPRAAEPAPGQRRGSACGPPARSCQPSPTTCPSFTSTQPTRGIRIGGVQAAPRQLKRARHVRRSSSVHGGAIHDFLSLGGFGGRAGTPRTAATTGPCWACGGACVRMCSISCRKASTSWKLR